MSDLIDSDKLKQIVEAALMAADEPLSVNQLTRLFAHGELDSEEGRAQIRETLKTLEAEADGRGYELKRVASGYRYQVRQELSEWVSRLWDEKPPRYTRALLETLALIAYKQPVTRGDIEQVRGVSISQNIMRTLQERNWIRVVGQREVPGKPSLYGTTREFLDYFDLKSLDQLPPLTEIKSLVEPLVVEEVAEEAREVAERDSRDDASSDTEPTDYAPDEASFEEERQQEVGEDAEGEDAEAEHVTEAEGEDVAEGENIGEGEEADRAEADSRAEEIGDEEDEADSGEEHPHSAEVVRLPTSPRR